MKSSLAVTLLVSAAACTAKAPAASSSAVLTPELTWVIVAKPAQPAALDVARMFQQRGFALSDVQKDERGVTLRFIGDRKDAAEEVVTAVDALVAVADVLDTLENTEESRHRREMRALTYQGPAIEHYDLGSVFYVRVEPRGETMTSIAAVGRPTRDGVEACTNDPIDAPCAKLASGGAVHHQIAGYAEAEVIHGVFSELRLAGAVVAPDIVTMARDRRCWQIRREREAMAARVSSAKAKAGILRTRPTCENAAPPASLASK
jgi:hypothetical protein